MKRVAIIGGGISGLSAAFTLEKARQNGAPVDYALFESSSRLGGVLVTERADGCLLEAGPDSFLTEKPWASDLSRELGLEDQLIGSNDHERKTYILCKGRLVEIPDGLMFMVPTKIVPTLLSPLFSLRTKLRMAGEWFHPPHKVDGDESVASMVERHYGGEMVDRLADPLLSGVYGGNASELSVRAVLPRFAAMEAKYGSLGRAMLAARAKMPSASHSSRPLFTSLQDGMQQLVDALVSRLKLSALYTNESVRSVQFQNGVWIVPTTDTSEQFDAVILATPTHVTSHLVDAIHAQLASELSAIAYTSSITINLGYDESVRSSLPPGFGFLVPRSEERRILAATFVHNKFPHRAPPDRALLRCFIGGKEHANTLTFSDAEIIGIVRNELHEILRITAEPLFARVYRWNNAMAQYGVGHLERLDRIDSIVKELPGLALAGNGYRGIGVPDCIRSGGDAAAKILTVLGVLPEQMSAAALRN
jgi:protoporphyrinogen/coproporphyrinogen III oxidase